MPCWPISMATCLPLKQCMQALENDAPDGILVAGDWISGPCENETFDLLQASHPIIPSWATATSACWSILMGKPPADWATPEAIRACCAGTSVNICAPRSLDLLRQHAGATRDPIRRHALRSASCTVRFRALLTALSNPGKILDQTFDELQESILVCGHSHHRPMIVSRSGGES